MIVHLATQRVEGTARRAVQTGGRGEYARFDYALIPAPDAEAASFVLRDVPAPDQEFVPYLHEGIDQARAALAECGEWFASLRVEITRLHYHDVGRNHGTFARLGRTFVQNDLRERCLPVRSLDPLWRTPDVLDLARLVHTTRDPSALPILADALEEAGCDLALLLDHCRWPGDHGTSCWAVQLALAEAAHQL